MSQRRRQCRWSVVRVGCPAHQLMPDRVEHSVATSISGAAGVAVEQGGSARPCAWGGPSGRRGVVRFSVGAGSVAAAW
jgi:hypothetical protein